MANYEIKKITKQKKKEQLVRTLIGELRAADRRELAAGVAESGSIENEVYDSVFLSEECFAAFDRSGLIAISGTAGDGGASHLVPRHRSHQRKSLCVRRRIQAHLD